MKSTFFIKHQATSWFTLGILLGSLFGFGTANAVFSPLVAQNQTPPVTATIALCDRPQINYDSILVKANEARLNNGLTVLASDPNANTYAQLRANELAETGDFTHKTKYINFDQWQQARSGGTKTTFSRGSELLSQNNISPCAVIDELLESPTHRAALLDPKNDAVGIGVAGLYTTFMVLDTRN